MLNPTTCHAPYVLGLDIGSNSLGWAVLKLENAECSGVLKTGVRIFPAGVDGSLEKGREESHAAKRRQMRLQRRQTDRRRRRQIKIYNLLSSWGLLPDASSSKERNDALTKLDTTLAQRYPRTEVPQYFLRARGLHQRLEPNELGRALYHLAQRRGFLSNRKAPTKDKDEDRSKVKSGIKQLWKEMADSDSCTLGEYLSKLNPHEHRIRDRWTHREMFLEEFETLWAAQAQHHPELLTEDRRQELFIAMFQQRPLKDQAELIGECELVPGEKRAPLWRPEAQRFRMLQGVNDLRLLDTAGFERSLTDEERSALITALDSNGDMTWPKIRKLLGIRKTTEINKQRGGEKKLTGNRTAAKLREAFLDKWDELTAEERIEAAQDAADEVEEDTLMAKAMDHWGLNGLQAEHYADIRLEAGKYLNLSLAALAKLLPRMEKGEAYMTAKRAEFEEVFRAGEAMEFLPPVLDTKGVELRNPAVLRALTEVRRVVNALIREYGKPAAIHIEMARDLKQGKSERERRWKHARQRQTQREKAIERIRQEGGPQGPSRADVERMLLAMECRFICPYTGKQFNYHSLTNGQVQVEHIVPFSRSLDDSYLNKTLCFADENKRKGNQTPWEYYGRAENPEWENIIARVRGFDSPLALQKLRRFQMKEDEVEKLLTEFSSRQLNDTRYMSKLAARYVSVLYGGTSDADRKQRIFVSPGQATAYLRRLWSLSRALSDSPEKNRGDHRQHAIDAVVVALTGPTWVKALADAAEQAQEVGRRKFASIRHPWEGFFDEVRDSVEAILVSHRPDHSIGGAFHAETNYSKQKRRDNSSVVVVRKPVEKLRAGEVESIVDKAVRERVKIAVNDAGGKIEKLALPEYRPVLKTKKGQEVPIRRVRIETRTLAASLRPMGRGMRHRLVAGGDNQHFEVFARLDKDGQVKKWDCAIVSKQDAAARVRGKEAVVRRDHGPGTRFAFSIAKNDILEIGPAAQRRFVVVKVLEGEKRVLMVPISEARRVGKDGVKPDRISINQLMSKHRCRKVTITPLGVVCPCND